MSDIYKFKIRTRYNEIDGMKHVNNSVYLNYFEEARLDLVRTNNYPYEKMEQNGIIFPVSEAKIKYKSPILYGDVITVETSVEYLKNYSIKFLYKIVKEDGTLCCEGYTIHACLNIRKGDFQEISEKVRKIVEPYIQ